jgi:hypothetical protein
VAALLNGLPGHASLKFRRIQTTEGVTFTPQTQKYCYANSNSGAKLTWWHIIANMHLSGTSINNDQKRPTTGLFPVLGPPTSYRDPVVGYQAPSVAAGLHKFSPA